MTLLEFIEDLESKGVELLADGERLRYRGEQAVLTADVLRRLKEEKAGILDLQRDRVKRSTLCPVSYAQAALWFLHELEPESPAYNVGFAAQVRSRVECAAMQRALGNLVGRHASLRTTFPTRNGAPVQQIHAEAVPQCEQVDCGLLTPHELASMVAETYSRPFNLETGPLLRFHLFTVSDEEHVMLVTVHHIVCDAWSLWLLLEELGSLYAAETQGQASTLPVPGASYADYVRWQRPFLEGKGGQQLWTYWKDRLSGELPVTNLPVDRARPSVPSFRGASFRFRLEQSLTDRIRLFAASESSTVYTVLLAAFVVLLHRYAGQDEIVVGSPTSGRTRRQFSRVVGDFINTVVLRVSCAGNPAFRDFLDVVGQTVLDAIAHEDFPFPLLVKRLSPGRESNRLPLFQVLFNFLKPQNFPEAIELWTANEGAGTIQWAGLSLGPFPLSQQEGQTDLTLEVAEGKTHLFGLFKYNVDLFDEETIVRMAGHFEVLLRSLIAAPDTPLSQLSLLTDTETQLLIERNNTHAEFPRHQCVHELFQEQAERTPQAIAAIFKDASLSYGELDVRSMELARRLKALGVRPDAVVGLCVERSLTMLVGLLGILRAGGAYLPLDPRHPRSRVDFIVRDSGIDLLVTQANVISTLAFDGEVIDRVPSSAGSDDIAIVRMGRARTANSLSTEAPAVTPDNLAYVIYTSGSTGQPKGVEIRHRGVVNFLVSMAQEPGFTSQDTILALTTVSFDIAVLELFLPLTVGARMVIAERQTATDPESLSTLIRACAATVVQATPATWRMLIDSGWRGDGALKILVGGEALSRELAAQLLPRCASLWNMYGPTETTIWSSTSRVESPDSISIGRPIANTQFHVLQHGSELAPTGVPGELYIGGEGLAVGYRNRPDLTAQAFLPNPLAGARDSRLYRTGDIVRYHADGRLEFIGRADHQIKIRGYRVELGEIEASIRQHPAVKEVVVNPWEDAYGDRRLVAYVVPAESAPVSGDLLRSHAASRLPEYMVPSFFVSVESFALTGSGKVDRKALPKPNLPLVAPAEPASDVRTPTQRALTTMWMELLGLQSVGLDDDLFHIGGDSLISVRLVSMIRQRLSVKLAVREVFSHPTIRALSEAVDSMIDRHEPPEERIVTSAYSGGVQDRSIRQKLGLGSESFLLGPLNRILQMAARVAPGVLRSTLHRWRGVRMGTDVIIGYDTVLETSYPWLVSIGSRSSIGMRVTIIGHFLGMEAETKNQKGVTVEIGEDVWIGPCSVILPNVVIGNGSVVAAGSVVSRSVPPHTMVQGNPAVAVARCPIPIHPGMDFDEFVKNLRPLDDVKSS